MAKRTRLGRDPLEKAAPSPTRATGRKAPKKAAAGQVPAPDAPAKKTPRPAKRAAATSETAVAAGQAPVQDGLAAVVTDPAASPIPAAQVQDVAAAKAASAQLPEAPESTAAGQTADQDDLAAAMTDPAASTIPAVQVQDVAAAKAASTSLPEAPESAAAGQTLVQDDLADTVPASAAPLPDVTEPAGTPPAAPASADCLPLSQTRVEPADSPVAPPLASAADHDGQTGQIPLCQGGQALTLFFRGVLDAFLPDDPQALRVVIDAGSAAVPLEKLLFFSQVLHRIVFPTARPDQFAGRSGEDCGPLPVLTVRLSPGAGDRHVLELFDNGRYFRERWPHPDLGLGALEPLTAYVVAHGGSIQLAKGRCVAFAVTG